MVHNLALKIFNIIIIMVIITAYTYQAPEIDLFLVLLPGNLLLKIKSVAKFHAAGNVEKLGLQLLLLLKSREIVDIVVQYNALACFMLPVTRDICYSVSFRNRT